MNSYYVYILGSRNFEHKSKAVKGFTAKYNIDQLLFFEEFSDIYDAMDAEHHIKGWLRKRKLELIKDNESKIRKPEQRMDE